jgi:hypothetical protein
MADKYHPERDHGMHDPGAEVAGRPVARPLDEAMQKRVDAEGGCPNCGCREVMEITIPMNNPRLKGGMGRGRYLGCPACPWASPMVTSAL